MRKYLILFALLAMASCGKEHDYFGKETDVPKSNLVDVSFNVTPDQMAVYGEPSETKSQITSDVDYAFNGAILFAFDHSTGKIKLNDNGEPYIKIAESRDFLWSLPSNEAMDIYTIVNYRDNIQGVEALISNKELTVSALTQITFTCKTVSGLKNIPMSGIKNNVLLSSTNNTVSIEAKRVFAKYQFLFDLSELKAAGYNVTATSLSACQSNTVVPLFYTGTEAGFRQTNPADLATIDSATTTDLVNLSWGAVVPLYFLENCQGNKSGAAHWYDVETSGISGLELCSYILVNVSMTKSGNDVSQTYKVFLGSDCTTNFDVVRNSSRTICMTLHVPTAPPQVVTYRMKSTSLASYTIQVGSTTAASSLKEKYVNGTPSGETVSASATYMSSNTSVAIVNASSGLITGITQGTAVITATDPSCEAGFQSVNSAPLTVAIAPETVTWRMKSATLDTYSITVGGTTTAKATKEKYVNGAATGETAEATATWISNSATIATINYTTGIVTGQVIGTASFTATDTSCETGFQSATTPVLSVTSTPETITWRMKSATPGVYAIAVGGTTTITALKEKYVNGVASGETAAASPVWSTSTPSIATVGPTSGLVTGVAAGSATIIGIDTSCEAGYQNTPPVTITVYDNITWRLKSASLNTYSITVGGTAQASAVKEKFVNGMPSGETASAAPTWSTSNSSVATINSSSGVVVGVAIGSVSFTAIDTSCESGYQSATTPSLSVSSVPETVTWRMKSASLADSPISVGGTTVASAVKEKYVNGSATGETAASAASWASSNTSVATINASTGVITGVAAGTATFTAVDGTCEAGFQTATTPPLSVTYTPTETWRLEPTTLTFSPSSISVGGYANCTTTLVKRKYQDGMATAVTAAPSLVWESSNTGVATVSGGTVTGVGAGSATITATDNSCEAGYRTASGSINVTSIETWRLEPSSLTFSPSSIFVGGTANCTTTLLKRKYLDGSPTSVTASPSLMWSTSNSSVATVSGGTVTGISAGSVTITATDNSCEAGYRSASGGVTVNAVTITSIHIEDPLGYVFYNQSHHAPICYVTLSNSETYNSDDNWIYFDWDSDDVSINSQSGEFDLDGPNGNYTITCYFTKDAIAGSTTATYTLTDYTYTYIGAELAQDYKTSTHVAFKIVCELKNDITNEHVYTTLYDVPVVYGNLTLTPSYESSAGGLWGPSNRMVPKGCQIRGYVDGTLIGEAYAM